MIISSTKKRNPFALSVRRPRKEPKVACVVYFCKLHYQHTSIHNGMKEWKQMILLQHSLWSEAAPQDCLQAQSCVSRVLIYIIWQPFFWGECNELWPLKRCCCCRCCCCCCCLKVLAKHRLRHTVKHCVSSCWGYIISGAIFSRFFRHAFSPSALGQAGQLFGWANCWMSCARVLQYLHARASQCAWEDNREEK